MLPSENVDILYRRSCILEHIKAYFEGFFFFYFAVYLGNFYYVLCALHDVMKVRVHAHLDK